MAKPSTKRSSAASRPPDPTFCHRQSSNLPRRLITTLSSILPLALTVKRQGLFLDGARLIPRLGRSRASRAVNEQIGQCAKRDSVENRTGGTKVAPVRPRERRPNGRVWI